MKQKYNLILLFILVSSVIYGQNVLQLVPYGGTAETELIAQIKADTTANHGIPADRVYELVGGGLYICQEQFYVEGDETLRLRSSNSEKPIIYLYPSGTGSNPQNPPGHFVRLRGGILEMKNIALSGIFEPDPNSINTIQGAMLRVDGEGAVIILDSCVFSNINGQVIRTESASKTIKVTNTIFTNLGALTTSNFGAGKGIDLRASSCDTLVLVNNTFTNYQDRVIRHYNFSNPLAGTGNIKYTLIDHNTFYNGMGFHGLLSLGNVGDEVIITNNLFKDAFAAGEDSTDETRSVEWANTGEKYPNGSNRMMWIFTAPNDSTVWNIKNNFYAISTEGQAFFDAHTTEPILEGPVLSWHINSKLGADSVNAFTKIADPGLVNTQDLMVNLMNFYVNPDTNVGANKTKETGSFDVTRDDMDRRPMSFWLTELDASYSTASPAYVGAEDGFPVGDLNWFPDQKAEWENPTPPLIIVDGEKDAFFAGLTGPDDGYLQLRSFAHSDNGAPTDDADLSVKLWSAWDDDWFYIYEEVTDDQVSGDAANVWEEDEIELKFDPQPTDSTVNSNWETRLTALGQSEGDAVQFDNLGPLAAENKQYFRKLTANGYVLEMGIKWAGIVSGTGSEKITPAVDNIFGFAINQHDNDETKARVASLTWAAKLLDALWNTPKYLGTAKFLAGNKLQYIPTNNMTGSTNTIPYDGSDLVGVDDVNLLPTEFAVSQNYPNPFNPTTMINYALPKKANVKLVVFNTIGQQVATLVNQEMIAGYHSINFDASKLSSGIYFYTLSAGDFISTQKMILLK